MCYHKARPEQKGYPEDEGVLSASEEGPGECLHRRKGTGKVWSEGHAWPVGRTDGMGDGRGGDSCREEAKEQNASTGGWGSVVIACRLKMPGRAYFCKLALNAGSQD